MCKQVTLFSSLLLDPLYLNCGPYRDQVGICMTCGHTVSAGALPVVQPDLSLAAPPRRADLSPGPP